MNNASKLFDLTGRTALITGSSAGIGLALARGLAGAGASIILNGRNAGKLEEAAESLREEGAFVVTAAFDVTDGDCRRGSRGAHRSRSRAPSTSWSTTPACSAARRSRSSSEAHWHELMKTNVDSVFLVGQAVARHMIDRAARQDHQHLLGAKRAGPPQHRALHRQQGRGEDAHQGHGDRLGPARHPGQRPRPGLLQDRADRGAGRATKSSARWLIGRTPSRRWGDVEDLVGAAVFLASDASNFVNGHILYVDGGVTATL